MSGRDEILQQADRQSEEGDFASAVQNFRAAALMSPDDLSTVLFNLLANEIFEHVGFIRQLKEKYPDSLDVRLHEVHFFLKDKRPDHVLILCTEILQNPLSERDERSVRYTRLEAAIRTRKGIASLVEDFVFLWERASTGRLRQRLLQLCSEVYHTEFLVVFEELANNVVFLPDSVREFMLAKRHELMQLENATRDLRDEREEK